jgi:hypothetical protein
LPIRQKLRNYKNLVFLLQAGSCTIFRAECARIIPLANITASLLAMDAPDSSRYVDGHNIIFTQKFLVFDIDATSVLWDQIVDLFSLVLFHRSVPFAGIASTFARPRVRGPVWLIRPTATNAGPADSANASKLE